MKPKKGVHVESENSIVVAAKKSNDLMCRAYDNLEREEAKADLKEKMADQVYSQIKTYKKKIKQGLKKELAKQVVLAEQEAQGLPVDPEAVMSPEGMMLMVHEASMMIDELEQQEHQLIQFKMGKTKKIKCPFCEHKGRSLMQESTPAFTYIIVVSLFFLLGIFSFLLTPMIFGILRQQIHRCPKCLNEIKEDSIFTTLDDDIMELSIGKVGLLVKRRTLVKSLLFVIFTGLFAYIFQIASEGPMWYLDGRQADPTLTWTRFVNTVSVGKDKMDIYMNFDAKFKNKVVQWEGKVLRVDGNDELESVFQDQGSDDWISNDYHVNPRISAEVLVQMSPVLGAGYFYPAQEFDLVLLFDNEHFATQEKTIENLHTGSMVSFKGFVSNLGSKIQRYNQHIQTDDKQHDENKVPTFQVMEITQLEKDDFDVGSSSKRSEVHSHVHKGGRYQTSKPEE